MQAKRSKKYKAEGTKKTITRGIGKIFSILFCTGLVATLVFVQGTNSFFFDTETVGFSASTGTLGMSVSSKQTTFAPSYSADNLKAGESVARDIYIGKTGSLPLRYGATVSRDASCNADLFDKLDLQVYYNFYTGTPEDPNYHEHRTMTPLYSGKLANFDLNSSLPNRNDLQIPNANSYFENTFYAENEHWLYFQITLPAGAEASLQTKSCNFNFDFNAWQTSNTDGTSGFSDTKSISNKISTGSWAEVSVENPVSARSLSMSINEDEIQPGDVVINEVMWMGSEEKEALRYDGPNDQWVELKNVSGRDLHFKDFYLTYKKNSGSELKLARITSDKIIGDGEYFLIANYNENNSAFKNVQRDNNESGSSDDMNNFDYEKFQIKLYTDDRKVVLIDTAGDGTQEPTKGDKDNFYSMERNNIPSNGADYDNWYTCLDTDSTNLYWDDDRGERGTPGHQNLSKNDPTSPDYDPNFQESEENIDTNFTTPPETIKPEDDEAPENQINPEAKDSINNIEVTPLEKQPTPLAKENPKNISENTEVQPPIIETLKKEDEKIETSVEFKKETKEELDIKTDLKEIAEKKADSPLIAEPKKESAVNEEKKLEEIKAEKDIQEKADAAAELKKQAEAEAEKLAKAEEEKKKAQAEEELKKKEIVLAKKAEETEKEIIKEETTE